MPIVILKMHNITMHLTHIQDLPYDIIYKKIYENNDLQTNRNIANILKFLEKEGYRVTSQSSNNEYTFYTLYTKHSDINENSLNHYSDIKSGDAPHLRNKPIPCIVL